MDSSGRFWFYLRAVPGPIALCPHSTGPKILDEVETFEERCPAPPRPKANATKHPCIPGSVMQLAKFPWSGYLHCLSGVFLDIKSINSSVPKSWDRQFISIREIFQTHIHQDCRPILEPQTHGQCPQRWLYAWSEILLCLRSPSSEYFLIIFIILLFHTKCIILLFHTRFTYLHKRHVPCLRVVRKSVTTKQDMLSRTRSPKTKTHHNIWSRMTFPV